MTRRPVSSPAAGERRRTRRQLALEAARLMDESGFRDPVQAVRTARVVVADVVEDEAHGRCFTKEEDRRADAPASTSRITVAAQAKPVAP